VGRQEIKEKDFDQMNEPDNTSDLTQDLSAVEMLRLVLADVREIRDRVSALEADAADRAKETRPKLDLIIAELAELRDGQRDAAIRLDRIEGRLDQLAIDVLDVRSAQRRLTDRVDDLERRPN
jgi:type I site-specific restriction endonuclease